MVAVECSVQQRRQSRSASMRKCPPVDHFGPRRGGGQARTRPRIRGARAHYPASARHPTAPDSPGCVPCSGTALGLFAIEKICNSRLSRYRTRCDIRRDRAFRKSHGPNHLHHQAQARPRFKIYMAAGDKKEVGRPIRCSASVSPAFLHWMEFGKIAGVTPAPPSTNAARIQGYVNDLQKFAAYRAETHPRGIVSNGVPSRYTSP